MLVPDGAVLLFDLGGTLVEVDGRMPDRHKHVLRELVRRAARVVLVTGQPWDDPQVQEVLSVFLEEPSGECVAYLTRGGLRLERRGVRFEPDEAYLSKARLDEELVGQIETSVARALTATGLVPRIRVRCIDEVAVRVNLDPADRPRFISALREHFAASGLDGLQVLAEGRTSVFVTRLGVGKRRAVEHELSLSTGSAPRAVYFGNEFADGGNDREVLGIPGLDCCALSPGEPSPEGAGYITIGAGPEDLYAAFGAALHTGSPRLPVLCVSLGGTKLALGALTRTGAFLSSPELHWRRDPKFAGLDGDTDGSGFAEAIVMRTREFLLGHGYDLSDVGVFGVPFPGPHRAGLWFSNNLPAAFSEGVALEAVLSQAMGADGPCVRVLFDAQCDAGGELYHHAGRLRGLEPPPTATVLNVATGIAAGFVKAGQVILSDEDIRREVAPAYDGGAGQFGRHLWFHHTDRRWRYHFAPHGSIPVIGSATRMTERLSGPALAARLLARLETEGALPTPESWSAPDVTLDELHRIRAAVAAENGDLTAATQMMRRWPAPVAGALLGWADSVRERGDRRVAECVRDFVVEVAVDLGAALTALWVEPGWEPFGARVVLTGGVGLRFLASWDGDPDGGFLGALGGALPGCRVERSRLRNATERECYLFLHQP